MEVLNFASGKYTYNKEGYVIVEANNHIEVTPEIASKLIAFGQDFFDKPYGIIAIRSNDYSVSFDVYKRMKADPMIKAVAVILSKKSSRVVAELEEHILNNKEYGIFTDIKSAKKWVLDQVHSNST